MNNPITIPEGRMKYDQEREGKYRPKIMVDYESKVADSHSLTSHFFSSVRRVLFIKAKE